MDEIRPGQRVISADALNDGIKGGRTALGTRVMGGTQKQVPGAGAVIDATKRNERSLVPAEFGVFILKDVDTYKDAVIGLLVGNGTEIAIAKPYLLRRTPFEGPGRERNGFRYTYQSNTKRTSIKVSDSNSTEVQTITPDYVINDEIVAKRFDHAFILGDGITTHWIDDNDDGREWAV